MHSFDQSVLIHANSFFRLSVYLIFFPLERQLLTYLSETQQNNPNLFLPVGRPFDPHCACSCWLQNKTVRDCSLHLADDNEFYVQSILVRLQRQSTMGLYQIWFLPNLVCDWWTWSHCSPWTRRSECGRLQEKMVTSVRHYDRQTLPTLCVLLVYTEPTGRLQSAC